jgi:hypothetical protein
MCLLCEAVIILGRLLSNTATAERVRKVVRIDGQGMAVASIKTQTKFRIIPVAGLAIPDTILCIINPEEMVMSP